MIVQWYDEAIARWRDGMIAITWLFDSEDAMLYRVTVMSLSRYSHHCIVPLRYRLFCACAVGKRNSVMLYWFLIYNMFIYSLHDAISFSKCASAIQCVSRWCDKMKTDNSATKTQQWLNRAWRLLYHTIASLLLHHCVIANDHCIIANDHRSIALSICRAITLSRHHIIVITLSDNRFIVIASSLRRHRILV